MKEEAQVVALVITASILRAVVVSANSSVDLDKALRDNPDGGTRWLDEVDCEAGDTDLPFAPL